MSTEAHWQAANFSCLKTSITFSRWPPDAVFCHEIHIFDQIFRTESNRAPKLPSTLAYWQAAHFGCLKTSKRFSKWPPQAVFHHKIHIFDRIFGTESHRTPKLTSTEAYWQAANFGCLKQRKHLQNGCFNITKFTYFAIFLENIVTEAPNQHQQKHIDKLQILAI
jgi:hypothetical protein